jgi:asparagine synthase (glutamine-hydrolysing)
MCGITGTILKKNTQPFDVSVLTERLHHRGPDGYGYHRFENVQLGHRRLAIIDLQTGHQPISNEDQTVWITFNGEIYNYKELREQLINKGHVFHTNSDTETIVHAYEEWGNDCVKHLRGMFAFAILDQNKRELLLARDHFGIKPLVYLDAPGLFAFASELQAFRALPDIKLTLDHNAIDQYLQFQFIPAPRTIYSEVKKLPAAHYIRVSFEGNILEKKRYWQLDFKPDHSKTEAQWLEELDAVLRESVKAHLVSDVPFGAFLSGGIDSSTVVGYMAQLMDRPVKTFSIGFEEDDFNETKYARMVAAKWNTDHREEIVRPDALAILPQLVKHYGEPFGDSSAVPTYYVSRLARQHVTMVLTGDAGDEMFAGYESYTTRWNRHVSPVPEHLDPVRKMAYGILNKVMPQRFPLRTAGADDWIRYAQTFSMGQRKDLWNDDLWPELSQHNENAYAEFFKQTRGYGHFQKAQFADFNTYMVDDILTKVDIAGMVHSLETRTPLLDINVVEFASAIPERFNIRKVNGQWTGKLLLKRLGEQYYTPEFLYRKKMGFAVPVKHWLVNGSRATGEIRDRILSTGNGLDSLFNKYSLERVLEKGPASRIWMLLFLQEWMSQRK